MERTYLIDCAEGLDAGQAAYFPHPGCTDNRKLWILRRPDGSVFGKCMKCHEELNVSAAMDYDHLETSLDLTSGPDSKSVLVSRKANEVPEDITLELPMEARKWLWTAGIDAHTAMRNGIGWSPSMRRVILPMRSGVGGPVVYWQGRNVGEVSNWRPKYLNPPVDKLNLRVLCPAPMFPRMRNTLVFTEDYLSALRVSRFFDACPALGTSPTHAHIAMARAVGYRRIVVWLDPDQAGREGAAKFLEAFQYIGKPVHVLESDRDPKCYSNTCISEMVRDVIKGDTQCRTTNL